MQSAKALREADRLLKEGIKPESPAEAEASKKRLAGFKRMVCVRRTTSPLAIGREASATLVTVGRYPTRCHDPASTHATRS